MKIQLLLFALLLLFTNFVKSDLLLKYIQFEYDIPKCSKTGGSSSDNIMTGGGSFGDEIKSVGGLIDSGTSDDSSDEFCDNGGQNSITYIKFGQCVPFGDWFAKFNINYNNDTVSKRVYFTNSCDGSSTLEYITLFKCYDDCKLGPYLYAITDTGDLEIPKGSFISAYYNGLQCNGWKNDFVQIEIFPLNRCLTTGTKTSFMYQCNSTSYEYIQSQRYDCNPDQTSIFPTQTEYVCQNYQRLIICYQ
ncbi:hypothetical protein ACTA71_000692 [Dictyostelium dimigraforme]